jgi:hypothetical protein
VAGQVRPDGGRSGRAGTHPGAALVGVSGPRRRVGAPAAAVVAVSLLHPAIRSLAGPGDAAAVVVDLAYPVLDLTLLVVVTGSLLVFEWRPPAAMWALGAGVAGFAVIDCAFVHLSATGGWRPGTPLSSASPALMALVAVAGWLPGRSRTGRREPLPRVVVPVLFALGCPGGPGARSPRCWRPASRWWWTTTAPATRPWATSATCVTSAG